MERYGDIQYLVDRPEPSEIFLKARQMAGAQLQKQFSSLNNKDVNSSYDGFKWVKAELTYPSFDNLTFAYKNSIFAVVIELINIQGSSFNRQQRERLLKACDDNNLIPCLFKIKIQDKQQNSFLNIFKGKDTQNDYELILVENGWNLFEARTNKKVNPETIAHERPTKMSPWELNNFAIQIVRTEIQKLGNEILSFCDLPEINPQIWFKGKNGNINWVIVKHITSDQDLNYREWVGLENKNPQLLPHDGFFAAVQFFSQQTNSSTDLNRGDAMFINYKGIERIYVS